MIRGVACPFGTWSVLNVRGTGCVERVEPGAFDESLRKWRPRFNWDHDRRKQIRPTWSHVWADATALRFMLYGVALPSDFSGCSIGFRAKRWTRQGNRFRLLEAELLHVALLRGKPPVHPATRELTVEIEE